MMEDGNGGLVCLLTMCLCVCACAAFVSECGTYVCRVQGLFVCLFVCLGIVLDRYCSGSRVAWS